MAMIKATYNFNLPNDLWDQLVILLQTVNSNHDVVDKWMDSIDDLMRQIFKHIYNIDLNSFKSSYHDEEENDTITRSLTANSRSGSVSSQIDEKRKQRNRNRDKQNHQSLILNSSSSNYLLAHTIQSNEKRGIKQNNLTYSPAVLSSVGLNKQSFQSSQLSQNGSQIPLNRQSNFYFKNALSNHDYQLYF